MRISLTESEGVFCRPLEEGRTMKQSETDGAPKRPAFVPPRILAPYDKKELEELVRPHLDVPTYR